MSSPPEVIRQFGLGDEGVRAWSESGLPPEAFEEWLTDRVARRPTGRRAREVYGAEDVHDFARKAILGALVLTAEDRLLEIGCGGGLLLRDALRAGASATGIDHSEEMVALARERAPDADVVLGRAEDLPFPDGSFTAFAMSIVFTFFADPARVLGECRRAASPGARLAVYTSSAELRGTPAAPEPLASQCRFYNDDELVALAQDAGFASAAVARDRGGQLLAASLG